MIDALPDNLMLIMEYVPLLITIAIPVALFISYRKVQNETENAKEIARLLSLKYINVADEMNNGKKEDSFLLNLYSRWSPWAMAGNYNGTAVRVELNVKTTQQRYIAPSSNVSSSNPTRSSYSKGVLYSVPFNNPLPFALGIGRTISMPFGLEANTLETGDKELDKLVSISGSEQDKILNWLNADQRKDVLKKLYQEAPLVIVNNEGLQLTDQNTRINYEQLKTNLLLLTKASLQLNKVDARF